MFNPITLRKAKIVYNFGLSECNRVKVVVLVPHRDLLILWKEECLNTNVVMFCPSVGNQPVNFADRWNKLQFITSSLVAGHNLMFQKV